MCTTSDFEALEQLAAAVSTNPAATVCSVCDALPYSRSAWPMRTTSNALLRAAAQSSSATAGGRERWPVTTVTSCPRRGQVRRLPVHVLGDAAELRVVVVGDDRDPHDRGMHTGRPDWHWRLRVPIRFGGRVYYRVPIYEYRCANGHTFDVLQSFSDEPLTSLRGVRRRCRRC